MAEENKAQEYTDAKKKLVELQSEYKKLVALERTGVDVAKEKAKVFKDIQATQKGINQENTTPPGSMRLPNRDSTKCLIVLSCPCQIFTAFSIAPLLLDARTGDSIGTVSPTLEAAVTFFKETMLGS